MRTKKPNNNELSRRAWEAMLREKAEKNVRSLQAKEWLRRVNIEHNRLMQDSSSSSESASGSGSGSGSGSASGSVSASAFVPHGSRARK
jgi:hypothetical protein